MTDQTPSSTIDDNLQKCALALGVKPITLREAADVAYLSACCRHTILLISETGTGKTAMIRQLCRAHDFTPVVFTLAHCEPSDICGPQMPCSDGKTFVNLTDGRIPFAGHEGGDRRVAIVFEEMNRCSTETMQAVMAALVEPELGPYKLGDNVIILAAMNPPNGDYAVSSSVTTDPAMRRRTCQVVVDFSFTDFVQWASDPAAAEESRFPRIELEPIDTHLTRPFHPSVLEYLHTVPDQALDLAARNAGKLFGCPATWHAVSDTLYMVQRYGLNERDPRVTRALQAKIAGHVGWTAAMGLLDYHWNNANALNPRELLLEFADPESNIRRRVMRLLEEGNAAALAGALRNTAKVWWNGIRAGTFTNEDVVKSVAAIFNVAPIDIGNAFMSHFVAVDRGHEDRGASKAVSELTELLHPEPDFRKFRNAREVVLAELGIAAEGGLE